MHEVCLAKLDKTRPVVILTRELARPYMTKVSVAPITSTVKGLLTEVPVGRINGLDHECAISCDNITTIPQSALGKTIGYLTMEQESLLARAIVVAFDLEIPLLGN